MSSTASEAASFGDRASLEEPRRTASRPVDLVHLSRHTLGERALEREVLELFWSQSAIYLDRLGAATSEQDWKDAAHALKGSARAIGAWRAATAAEGAEMLSGEALSQGRAARLREIETVVDEVNAYIGLLLKDR